MHSRVTCGPFWGNFAPTFCAPPASIRILIIRRFNYVVVCAVVWSQKGSMFDVGNDGPADASSTSMLLRRDRLLIHSLAS